MSGMPGTNDAAARTTGVADEHDDDRDAIALLEVCFVLGGCLLVALVRRRACSAFNSPPGAAWWRVRPLADLRKVECSVADAPPVRAA
jgi:hypothetical protein